MALSFEEQYERMVMDQLHSMIKTYQEASNLAKTTEPQINLNLEFNHRGRRLQQQSAHKLSPPAKANHL